MSPDRYLRSFDVLNLLVQHKNGLRLTEIKEALGLPEIFAAAGSTDKTMHVLKRAKHYYQGQPELLAQATQLTIDWMRSRKLLAD